MAGKTYTVGSDGNAPKEAGVGDFVQTAGGIYEILDGANYKNLDSKTLKGAGIGYNPTTGLYSMKVSNNNASQYNPVDVTFDTGAWKENYLNKIVGGLDKNYATDSANLEKTYNTNMDSYQESAEDVNSTYNDAVAKLAKQAYLNNVLAKQQAASQGLTSTGQGIALAQSVLNTANSNSAELWKSREETLSDIERSINNLTANFNIDKDTLKKAYNADKLGAMSDAELQALEKQLQIDTANVANQNQWGMTKYSTENANAQAEKDRALQLMGLQYQDQWHQDEMGAKYASMRASSKSDDDDSKYDADYETQLANNYMTYLSSTYGDWRKNLSPEEVRQLDNVYTEVQAGRASAKDFEVAFNYIAKNKQAGNNTGGFWSNVANYQAPSGNKRVSQNRQSDISQNSLGIYQKYFND